MCKLLRLRNNTRINSQILHQIMATVFCNLAAVITGSGFSWLAPIALRLTSENSEIKMTLTDFSWLTSSAQISFLLFVIPSGTLADRYGRKKVLIMIAPISLTAWTLAACTRNMIVLYIIRFLQGIIMAISFTVAPMYIAEVASPNVRGFLGGQFSIMLYIGNVFSYLAGSYLSYQNYIYILMLIPMIFLITFVYMPESPYYYFMVHKTEKAYSSYHWLINDSGENDSNEELLKIEESVQTDMTNRNGWMDLIARKSDVRSLAICQLVSLTRCITGLPAYTSYATQMFASTSKNSILTSNQLSIIMMLIFSLSAFFANLYSDTAGRRRLIIISSFGTILANLSIFIYFLLEKITSINLTIWFMYLSIITFCITSNIGIGQLQMVIQAECFPSHTRSRGGAITSMTTAIATFLVLSIYQKLTDSIGIFMNFLMYALFTSICIILIIIYVPETSGKSLAEVNSVLVKK